MWYELVRIPAWAFFHFGCGLRVEGGAHIPSTGPVLLIANHQSYFDPPIVGLATARQLNYLGRSTLFTTRFFSWLIRSLGCVPINVEAGGRDGLETTLALLREDRAVLIFPEGERSLDGSVLPLKPGIRLLIKHSGAPVIPIGIAGAFESYSRHDKLPTLAPLFLPKSDKRLAVSVGAPLLADKLKLQKKQALLDYLHNAICEQKERAEHLRGQR